MCCAASPARAHRVKRVGHRAPTCYAAKAMSKTRPHGVHPAQHHGGDATTTLVGVLTVSDTRTLATDTAGDAIVAMLGGAGHELIWRQVVPDEVEAIRRALRDAIGASVHAVVITGGTGVSPRDVTPQAVEPLLTRRIPGFGEQLRALSYAEVGVHGLLSLAFAGVIGTTVVFALPGSPRACDTAMTALVLPMLPHVVGLARPHATTA